MKGADMETDIWKIRVQLMKPVTWIPLIWGAALAPGAACVVAQPVWLHRLLVILPVLLPLLLLACIAGRPRAGAQPPRRAARPPHSRAGVLCGAAASGAFTWTPENVAKSLLCMVMSGPLLTGYTQACRRRRCRRCWQGC